MKVKTTGLVLFVVVAITFLRVLVFIVAIVVVIEVEVVVVVVVVVVLIAIDLAGKSGILHQEAITAIICHPCVIPELGWPLGLFLGSFGFFRRTKHFNVFNGQP